MLEILKNSFSLLSRRARVYVWISILFQSLVSLLDLLGIALLAASSLLALKLLGTSEVLLEINWFSRFFQYFDAKNKYAIFLMVFIALVLFISKTFLSGLIISHQLKFLSLRDLEITQKAIRLFLKRDLVSNRNLTSQEMISAMTTGAWRASAEIFSSFIVIASEIALLSIIVTFLFVVDAKVTFFALLYFLLIFSLLHFAVGKKIALASSASVQADIGQQGAIRTMLIAAREINVMNREEYFASRFMSERFRYAKSTSKILLYLVMPKMLLEVSMILGVLLLVLLQFMQSNPASVATSFALYLTAGTRILPSLLRLQNAISAFRSTIPGAQIFFDFYKDLEISEDQSSHVSNLKNELTTEIGFSFNKVSFTYFGSDCKALDDISLQVAPGSSCAIIGNSGSGKSTLVDMVLGILKPSDGHVNFHTKYDSNVSKSQVKIGFVPQNVAIVTGSLRENIAFGYSCTDGEIWKVLEYAGLKDHVQSLPQGLETLLTDIEVSLSGGQIQRIAIARALLGNPSILVFDEATSGLDDNSHNDLVSTILNLKFDSTVLFISHNLSRLSLFDQIVQIENGKIDFSGSYEDFDKKFSTKI